MPPLWRDANFRRIWAGQTASIFGDRVTDIALPWLILTQTRSAFDAGLVAAARYAPIVALGLIAGVVVDRVPRRVVLLACDGGRAMALGCIVGLALAGRSAPLGLLALVVVALGIGQLGFQAAYWAWMPDVIGEARYGQATAALEAADAASTLSGPALGGALIQVIGPALALGADALSYVVSFGSLAAVRQPEVPRPAPTPFTSTGVRQDITEGIHAILAEPAQRLLRAMTMMLYVESGTITVLLAVLTQQRLHLPSWQAGLIFGAAGIGGLVGSALAPRLLVRPWLRALAPTFGGAALGLTGLAIACYLTGAAAFVVAFAANTILDGSMALAFIISGTASTLITPRAVRGRVFALSNLYAALARGGSLILAGAFAVSGNPFGVFVAIAAGFGVAIVAALRGKVEQKALA
jgi:MFS family permease